MAETIMSTITPGSNYSVRLLNIMVERIQSDKDNFSEATSIALHEYADAISRGEKGKTTPDTFRSSNGCDVSVIAGSVCDVNHTSMSIVYSEK
jgi:hypothetical protein